MNFHTEKVLWDEISQMTDVLRDESTDHKDNFYKGVAMKLVEKTNSFALYLYNILFV